MHTLEQYAVDNLCAELLTKVGNISAAVGREGLEPQFILLALGDVSRRLRELREANSPAMAAYATAERARHKRRK